MWKCSPSATSAAPTSSRNDSASILTVGWALTKRAVGSAASSMTAMAITIAATMIGMCSAMPIAVITEFEGEHQVEHDDLGDHGGEGRGARDALAAVALEHVVHLGGALDDQEQTAAAEHDVAPGHRKACDLEDRLGQADHPGQAEQEQDAGEQRQAQADAARQSPAAPPAGAPRRSRGR